MSAMQKENRNHSLKRAENAKKREMIRISIRNVVENVLM